MSHIFYTVNNGKRLFCTSVEKESPQTVRTKRPSGFWNSSKNQLEYMNWLSKQLNFNSMEDWYRVSIQDFSSHNGATFINYSGSPANVVMSVFRDYNWLPWKFNSIADGFWNDENNQLRYLNWLSKCLNFTKMEDWYNISQKEFIENDGKGLLSFYGGSPSKVIMSLFPNYEWLPWKFNVVPDGYWSNKANVAAYLTWLGKELGYKSMEDWYQISTKDLSRYHGKSLLNIYGSPAKLVNSIFTEYNWLPWKFNSVPHGFWSNKENQLKYMSWLSKQLNIQSMEDWYDLPLKDIRAHYGSKLLDLYNNSKTEMIMNVFSDYQWLPWKFARVPHGFWDSKENQEKYMKWLAKELNINSMEDWYQVSVKDILQNYGQGLLERYSARASSTSSTDSARSPYVDSSNPLSRLMQSIFPNYEWDIYRFQHIPRNHKQLLLDSAADRKQFVEYLAKTFNVTKTEDWYSVTHEKLLEIITMKISDVMVMVKEFYPDLNLQVTKGNPLLAKKSQYILKSMLDQLFPGSEILEEYRSADVRNLEFDYFIPDLKIAFEYQGIQHYSDQWYFRPTSNASRLDAYKAEKCQELGITLVYIPYWWDKGLPSLRATIYNSRPELLSIPPEDIDKAIPLTPPGRSYVERKRNVIQSQMMLATNWSIEDDPTGWWMSEKYDGIRALWTGNKMYSRSGREIKVPDFFRIRLPPFSLDGELWIQRGLFQQSLHLTHNTSVALWKKATFCIFDAPDQYQKPYEDRIQFLSQFARDNNWPSFMHLIETVRCQSRNHLLQFYADITKKLGEGVMLREPLSKYEQGRSKSLRKYKDFQDTEVKVIKNMYPHGFLCQQTDGQTLYVGLNNEHLKEAKNVKEDDVITVKFYGVNLHKKLMSPKFFRIRTDVTWKDLVAQMKTK